MNRETRRLTSSASMGGIAAAGLGVLADARGIETVFLLCSFLPILGCLTILLPRRLTGG